MGRGFHGTDGFLHMVMNLCSLKVILNRIPAHTLAHCYYKPSSHNFFGIIKLISDFLLAQDLIELDLFTIRPTDGEKSDTMFPKW